MQHLRFPSVSRRPGLTLRAWACAALLALSAFAHAHSPTDARLLTAAQQAQPAFLDTLKSLVEIESSSRDADGVRAIAKLVARKLQELGGDVHLIEPLDGVRLADTPEAFNPVVHAVFRGTGSSRLMFIAHMDTVYPRGTLREQPFRVEGDKAYGLAIYDDKQGVALIIQLLALLKQLDVKDYGSITVLINGDEEISSPGSRTSITRVAQDQDAVLSFEGTNDQGALILATSGIGAVYLDVKGHAAHAGVQPEAGVNALTELVHQLAQMQDVSRPEQGTKLNWTLAQAGTQRNVIPEHASAQADARGQTMQEFDALQAELNARAQRKLLPGAEVSLRYEIRRPPMLPTRASQALATRLQTIYQRELKLPLPVITTPSGGGTDAGFAAMKARGAVMEGMGLSGDGAHGSGPEYVLLPSLTHRLYAGVRLVQELSRTAPATAQ